MLRVGTEDRSRTKKLVPLDKSEAAEEVLPYALFLAGALKIPIELLAVIDIDALAAALEAKAHRYLDTLCLVPHLSSGRFHIRLAA
jgi:hypothetical protein